MRKLVTPFAINTYEINLNPAMAERKTWSLRRSAASVQGRRGELCVWVKGPFDPEFEEQAKKIILKAFADASIEVVKHLSEPSAQKIYIHRDESEPATYLMAQFNIPKDPKKFMAINTVRRKVAAGIKALP